MKVVIFTAPIRETYPGIHYNKAHGVLYICPLLWIVIAIYIKSTQEDK